MTEGGWLAALPFQDGSVSNTIKINAITKTMAMAKKKTTTPANSIWLRVRVVERGVEASSTRWISCVDMLDSKGAGGGLERQG